MNFFFAFSSGAANRSIQPCPLHTGGRVCLLFLFFSCHIWDYLGSPFLHGGSHSPLFSQPNKTPIFYQKLKFPSLSLDCPSVVREWTVSPLSFDSPLGIHFFFDLNDLGIKCRVLLFYLPFLDQHPMVVPSFNFRTECKTLLMRAAISY